MLEKSGYVNVLRTMQEPITMLAPSDEAFQKLKDTRREKIINDREARLGKSKYESILLLYVYFSFKVYFINIFCH